MSTSDNPLSQLIINELTEAQYEALTPEANQLYLTPDTTDQDIADAISTHNTSSSAHSNLIPSQSGNSGKFLTTNGSATSWATVDALPSQTSQSGKFLTTNGTTASWANIPTEIPSQSGNSGKFLTTDGSAVSWATIPAEVFWATYGTTTFSDIMTAINANKFVCAVDSGVGVSVVYTYRSHTSSSVTFCNVSGSSTTLVIVDDTDTWETVDNPFVPSQTGNSGKFLTTDGSATSWATITIPTVDQTYSASSTNAQSGVAIAGAGFLKNTATGTNSLTLLGTAATHNYATNIGVYTTVSTYATALGSNATASGSRSTAIGRDAVANSGNSTALGESAYATNTGATALGKNAEARGDYSIQIGAGTNSTAGTLAVGFNGTNYQLLDGATGKIPTDRIDYDDITVTKNSSGKLQALVPTRNIGEFVPSVIPLTDAGLHLLDGSLISGGGRYDDFVKYMGDLFNDRQEELFSQPVLTANGTLGGDTFAVYASNNYDATTYPIWKSFDGDSSTIWFCSAAPVDVTIYNPEQMKIDTIQCQNRSDAANFYFTAGSVYGSNDGITWTSLADFTNSISGAGADWYISVNSSAFYNYYKVSFSSASTTGVGANFTLHGSVKKIPSCFTTESIWQTTATTYGVCGKFVYGTQVTHYAYSRIDVSGLPTVYTTRAGGEYFPNDPVYDEDDIQIGTISSYGSDSTGSYIVVSENNMSITYYRNRSKDFGVDTVRLPKITGLIEGTTDVSALGELVEQFVRLPNISGYASLAFDTVNYSGCFGGSSTWGSWNKGSGSGHIWGGLQFDAWRSSSVYSGDGTNTKIQPQAIKMLYYMVIANVTKPTIQANIDNAVTDINRLSKSYVVENYVNGASWYRVWSDGWCEQGGIATLTTTAGVSITFLKPFVNTNYEVITNIQTTESTTYGAGIAQSASVSYPSKTTSSVGIYTAGINNFNVNGLCWVAKGYTAVS